MRVNENGQNLSNSTMLKRHMTVADSIKSSLITERMQKGNEFSTKLLKYIQTPEIQVKLERIPESDAFFLSGADVKVNEENEFVVTNPKLVYCEGWHNNSKPLKIHQIEFEPSKKLDRKVINTWLDNIIEFINR